MGFRLKHINKYMRWIKKHHAAYKKDCEVSREYARLCSQLDTALLMKKTGAELDEIAMKKHEWVLSYMEKACCETIEKYKNMPAPANLDESNPSLKVWSMWWQGEEKADPLFRMCIDSARRHSGQEVITLSKDNYRKYFEIPDYILKKQAEGKIALQHVCDLMVMSIMAAEGGVFTGATVWWSQDVDESFLRTPYFTCKAEMKSKLLMSRSRWVGYVMAGNKEFLLWPFVRDCLHEYWKKCDRAVDYLMMDYLYELAYRHIPSVQRAIDELPNNNLLRNELIENLSAPYDQEAFKKYTKGETFLYKLSWKFGKKDTTTADGRLTNYGHMLQECEGRV